LALQTGSHVTILVGRLICATATRAQVKNKKVLIGVGVLVVVLAGGAYFMAPSLLGGGEAAAAAAAEAEAEDDKEPVPGSGVIFELSDRVVNLAEGGDQSFAKIKLALEFEVELEEAGGHGGDPAKDFKANVVDVADFNERIVGAYNNGTAEEGLDADDHLARSVMPAGTGSLRDFSYIAPDIPEFPLLLSGPDAWHTWHQVFTHSLAGLLWIPPVLALLVFRWDVSTRFKLGMAYAGWALHVALDVVARWPVPLLWPVSDERYALNRLDADFSWGLDMLLVVGLAITLWGPARAKARLIAVAVAGVLAGWLILGLPT
jgi:membrane-bound metal-dependent hydrolase YbcI (DUF457 family)